jgi:hypothetical protein
MTMIVPREKRSLYTGQPAGTDIQGWQVFEGLSQAKLCTHGTLPLAGVALIAAYRIDRRIDHRRGATTMKPLAIAGLVLVALGGAGLVFGRFSYTTEKKVIDVGPVTASVAKQHNVDVPDIAGIGAIIAGTLLVFFSRRTT